LAWKVLAACYFQVGRYKDAIEAGKKTQELRPTDDGNAYLVGAAYGRIGEQGKMERYARQVAQLRGEPELWQQVIDEYRGKFD
ncbi:MAG: tetratricopeptide repeat protein, partial [Anaerolineae bacterium]